ncbi:hypothetical protein CWB99_23595 [Pseudoalteromonas rubra]|uniref:Uncharacterized protein n=1 Tax=Pseudoalteromonas rubra TaxID=43658 RepID=A0A5S3WFX5_9GAMM|nr:hypothetical protein [Pseudoalteromonas rubra]TMP23082.1 hypothetical protein CWB99_23595 [Pseudoalteromonas rubra]TMP27460.1 hypothetical protein CWC00_23370 [Pseudoalteromonas rubra]
MTRVKAALAGLVMFSGSALAAWTPPSEVLALRAYNSSEGHYVKLSTSSVNEACSGTLKTGIYFFNDTTGRIFSMLLAAQSSKQKVILHVSGCGGGSYANITEVQLGDVIWGSYIE